ncbi:MAG: hypothetical protein Q9192_004478 [Flavoplaca navasiana]
MSDGGCTDPDGNLGVFSLNVTPSEASAGDKTSLQPDVSTRHDQQHNKKASVVDYDDEDEQLNSELQLIFDQNALVGRQSSWSYDKVAVLLIAWDRSCDDLNTNEEVIQSFLPLMASAYQTLQVDDLARVFRETYHYKVQNVRLKANGVPIPQVQVNKSIADFVHEEDGPSTLLVVYYAGHGTPGQRQGNLELTGKRSPTIDAPATVVWNYAEASLRQTLADIFEIFDCCYAGDLGRGSRGGVFGTRSFEYLGATSSGATTKAPGPGSFSSALIWALGVLAKESGGFTTNTLANKIREAPNFPKKQVPILTERNDLSSLQRIVIHPLPDGNEASTTAPAEDQDMTSQQPWGFLDLKISLEQCPTTHEIGKFGKDIAMMMQSTELKVRRVKWGGLYPTGGLHSPMVRKVVKTLLHIGRKRRVSSTSQSSPGALSPDSAAFILEPTKSKTGGRLLLESPSGGRSLRQATYHFDMGFRSVADFALFEVDENVWVKNPATNVFTWIMCVVDKRYDDKKPGWEYILKDSEKQLYKQGAWVSEKELNEA